jgi:hypothetical protein
MTCVSVHAPAGHYDGHRHDIALGQVRTRGDDALRIYHLVLGKPDSGAAMVAAEDQLQRDVQTSSDTLQQLWDKACSGEGSRVGMYYLSEDMHTHLQFLTVSVIAVSGALSCFSQALLLHDGHTACTARSCCHQCMFCPIHHLLCHVYGGHQLAKATHGVAVSSGWSTFLCLAVCRCGSTRGCACMCGWQRQEQHDAGIMSATRYCSNQHA